VLAWIDDEEDDEEEYYDVLKKYQTMSNQKGETKEKEVDDVSSVTSEGCTHPC
jgi:hypothetical protein